VTERRRQFLVDVSTIQRSLYQLDRNAVATDSDYAESAKFYFDCTRAFAPRGIRASAQGSPAQPPIVRILLQLLPCGSWRQHKCANLS
jgi:hypothetical protein